MRIKTGCYYFIIIIIIRRIYYKCNIFLVLGNIFSNKTQPFILLKSLYNNNVVYFPYEVRA